MPYSDQQRTVLRQMRKTIIESCTTCAGRGYVLLEDGDDEPCRCTLVFKYVKELLRAGIANKYWALSLPSLEIRDVYKKLVAQYIRHLTNAADKSLGFLFEGANGVGKTACLAEIGKAAIVHGYRVQYITVEQYITEITKPKSVLLDAVNEAKFILLDELDKVYIKEGSSFVPKKIEDFIRSSVSHGKTISIATNMDDKMLAEVFGDSFVSMLARYMKFVPFAGEDFSKTMQRDWLDELKSAYDYFDSNIVAMAEQRRKLFNADY